MVAMQSKPFAAGFPAKGHLCGLGSSRKDFEDNRSDHVAIFASLDAGRLQRRWSSRSKEFLDITG